jgi:hypothetical protein
VEILNRKGFATEMILTIGVLIASGILLLQLRGVFYGQTRLSQEEVASAFADDLENIVDKAIAVTGNASFVYYPVIKSYTLTVKNNTVSIHDKISKKTASFTKISINLQDMAFEDSEIIYIIKVEDSVYILGKCREKGESCSYSIMCCPENPYCFGSPFICHENCADLGENAADDEACCSGFLNKTTGKCDEPPFCPADRICTGAPESSVIGGKDCCPADRPVCSYRHCCPVDRPVWCNNPNSGDPRCMNEIEYNNDCKPEQVYVIAFIPAFYSDLSAFNSRASFMKDFTERNLPFRENPAILVILIGNQNCPMSNEDDIITLRNCGNKLAQDNGYPGSDLTGGILGVCYEDGCGGVLGRTAPGQGWFIAGYDMCVISGCPSVGDSIVAPHEIGHNFRLCEGYAYHGGYREERIEFGGYCGTPRIEQKFPYQRSAVTTGCGPLGTDPCPCGGCGGVCCLGRILDDDPINPITRGRDIMGPGRSGVNRAFACDSYLAFKDVAINVFNFNLPAVTNSDISDCYDHIKGDTYP